MFNTENVVVKPQSLSNKELYAQSDLVLTDYSSAVYDFVYLRKPVLYAHFDKDEFFSGKHTYQEGDFFDYERDGFGEIATSLEEVVDYLIGYMQNGCQLKNKYRKRIDNTFAHNDQKNCERVYQKVCDLLKSSR
jgi:CDP-glycerol glycerophosphotransferase (TagB/SpsB family)